MSSKSKGELIPYLTQNFTKAFKCVSIQIWSFQGFLEAQWWRLCLPMQETWVWFLICEDPTFHRAIKPMGHNYGAHVL